MNHPVQQRKKNRRVKIELDNFRKEVIFDKVEVSHFTKIDVYTYALTKRGRLAQYFIIVSYKKLYVLITKVTPEYSKLLVLYCFKATEEFDDFINKLYRAIDGDTSSQQYMCRELFG